MNNHNDPDHADAPPHGAKTNSPPEWSGSSSYRMSELGEKFGSTPNSELTEAELQTLAEEIGAIEDKMKRGDYPSAALRLNSFWDDWTEAAVEAKIKADSKNKEVSERYGQRLDQAKQYDLLGKDICKVLQDLNEHRHKPGHETWTDVDTSDPDFQKALNQALEVTKKHYEHLEQEHT